MAKQHTHGTTACLPPELPDHTPDSQLFVSSTLHAPSAAPEPPPSLDPTGLLLPPALHVTGHGSGSTFRFLLRQKGAPLGCANGHAPRRVHGPFVTFRASRVPHTALRRHARARRALGEPPSAPPGRKRREIRTAGAATNGHEETRTISRRFTRSHGDSWP